MASWQEVVAVRLQLLRAVKCPLCGAGAGQPCVFVHLEQVKGRPMNVVHGIRSDLVRLGGGRG